MLQRHVNLVRILDAPPFADQRRFQLVALVQRAGIDLQAQGLIAHRETIDIIGEVNCWVGDLNASWKVE